MGIIEEYEATKGLMDLYMFEVWCIDFLRGIKQIRGGYCGDDKEFTRSMAYISGNFMLTTLPSLLSELEGYQEEGKKMPSRTTE